MGRASVKKRRSNSPDWIASGRKLDWHASGHRQQIKCHRGNDEPQLCTCCDRESTGLIVKDGSSAPRRWCTRPTEPATGRTAGRMISNLAGESLPGSGPNVRVFTSVRRCLCYLRLSPPDCGCTVDVVVCGARNPHDQHNTT